MSSIKKNYKSDNNLKVLQKRSKLNSNTRLPSTLSSDFVINKDIFAPKNPFLKKQNTLKNIKMLNNSFQKNQNKKNNYKNYKRQLTQLSINNNNKRKTYKNIMEKIKDNNNNRKNILKTNAAELSKNMIYMNKMKKLDNLKLFFKLLDTHKKTQYEDYIDPIKSKKNFIRAKNYNFNIYEPCITYNKNNLFFSKKYKLIFDKMNRNNNIYKNSNFISNSEENMLSSYSTNYSRAKNKLRNSFLIKKKLVKINSDKLFLHKANIDKNKLINLYTNNFKPNKNIVANNFDSLTDDKTSNNSKNNQYPYNKKNINNNSRNLEVAGKSLNSNYGPQISLSNFITKIDENKKYTQNETEDMGETSTFSLNSNINNLKLYKNSINNRAINNYSQNINKKFPKRNNKILIKMLSESLKKCKKFNNILKINYINKEKEEEEKERELIKHLIKKKKTDLSLLAKELNLNYKKYKIDIEELVTNNVYKLKRNLQNITQLKLLSKVANRVILEDKILSKEVILESALARKLKKRIKSKSEREFELTILKRKELKNNLLKNKEKNDDEQIKGYLKNEIPDFYDLKSLEEMVKKYRTMSH